MTIGNLILVNFCHMNVLCIMQIATYNLNGIRSALNKGWMNWMQETSFDVVCIQELKAQNEQIDLEAFAQAGYHVYTETAEKRDIVAWPFSASRSRIMWNMAVAIRSLIRKDGSYVQTMAI